MTLSTVRLRLDRGEVCDGATIRVLGNFGYADRIQKYSCLPWINDTSSRECIDFLTLRQIRAYSRLALRLLIAVTKHRRDPRSFKLIDKRNLHVCGEKEDLNDDY